MDEVPIIQLIGLSVSLVLSACFSAAEALISRLSKDEIREKVEEGGWGADVITSLLQEPRKYSATIIVAKSCLIVAIVYLVVSIGKSLEYPRIVAPIISTILIVIFTEIVPKNYIKGRNRNSLVYATRFIQISYIILYFIVKPLTLFGYLWVRVFGGKVSEEKETLASPEEIEALVNVGDSEEILEKEERDMIYRIFDLPDTIAREVMIPRTDMVCLDVSISMDEILETVVSSRHSRIPVYEGTIDNIIGILHVKDIFESWRAKQPINLSEIIANRPPFFTPESKKIKDLLKELRANKQRMAIIVDEYGGTAGLLTTEDIIEEIVGEIQDEDETGAEGFEIQYMVDSKVDISKLNELLGANLF
ncbi:HlyC/CorC family transporter, partial [bacterium]|nr:HlyC/CorC family transporter [bacterium]